MASEIYGRYLAHCCIYLLKTLKNKKLCSCICVRQWTYIDYNYLVYSYKNHVKGTHYVTCWVPTFVTKSHNFIKQLFSRIQPDLRSQLNNFHFITRNNKLLSTKTNTMTILLQFKVDSCQFLWLTYDLTVNERMILLLLPSATSRITIQNKKFYFANRWSYQIHFLLVYNFYCIFFKLLS